MTFADSFLNFFSPSQRESEMVKQIAAIGTVSEQILLEEINPILQSSLDFASRTPDQLRSALAFFYVPVRHFTSSKGTLTFLDGGAQAPYTIPAGSQILTTSGLLVYTAQDQYVAPYQSYTIPVKQGQIPPSFTGIYSSFIDIQVDNIDLDTITVSIEGQTIPRVKFAGLAVNSQFAAQGTSVTPSNGFFAVYYGGHLYIKVYPGANVPPFDGKAFAVSVYVSDGAAGNITENGITSFVNQLLDGYGNVVNYTLTNPPLTGGLNAPLRSELLAIFLYWLFTKNNVTSVSDFARWFRAYPGVVDVSVSGDYEDFAAAGFAGSPTITGKVRVSPVMYLASSSYGRQATVEEIQAMEALLAPVRDIGITDYLTYGVTKHLLTVRYVSVQNESFFQTQVASILNDFYDVNFAADNAFSLFADIDLTTLTANFPYELSPLGLELLFTFYLEAHIGVDVATGNIAFLSSKTVPGGVLYSFIGVNVSTPTSRDFYEVFDPSNAYVWKIVYDSAGSQIQAGTHDYLNDVIQITGLPLHTDGTLYIKATPKNRSSFSSGSRYSIRQIQPQTVPSPLPSGVVTAAVLNGILFEKYQP